MTGIITNRNGERKSRRRRGEAGGSSHGSPSNTVELGAILSFFVIGLYFYAVWESNLSLPDVETNLKVRPGVNLNLARLGPESTPILAVEEEFSKSSNAVAKLEMSDEEKGGHVTNQLIGSPIGKWPVTVRDETSEYETLIHPGDLHTPMLLPKLWSPPQHNKQFFTRDMAMKVGTCIEPEPHTGSYVRGDKCPLHQRTVYIAIASYRDFQCRQTVESVFNRAKHPERLRVGKCF